MAMNKAERAEMQRLQDELALAKAWRLTEPVEPGMSAPAKGWYMHSYDLHMKVQKAVTAPGAHYVGEQAWEVDRRTNVWSQGSPRLHSKKSAALKAGRQEIERRVIRKLAEIDAQIAGAEAEERA